MYLIFSIVLNILFNTFVLTTEVQDDINHSSIPLFNEGPDVTFIPSWAVTKEGQITLLDDFSHTKILLVEGRHPIKYPIEFDYEPSTSYSSDQETTDSENEFANSKPNITEILSNVDNILNDYLNYTSQGTSDVEIIQLSLQYVDSIIPQDIWACSEQDIRNTSHKAYMFMDEFNSKANLDTERSRVSFIQINAAFNTRNIINLSPENKKNVELVTQVFDSCMQQIIKQYTS